MSEVRYIISDASRKLRIEPHALRYWEEELNLEIPRNEMGHRYYTEENVELLKKIKKLKEKGFGLKAIKLALPQIDQLDKMDEVNLFRLREEYNLKAEGAEGNSLAVVKNKDNKIIVEEEGNGIKIQQFKTIMKDLISDALRENNQEISETIGDNLSDNVLKEMDYLMRNQEEKDEERFRHLDELIRGIQKSRQEAAAAEVAAERKKKDKKRLFGKRK